MKSRLLFFLSLCIGAMALQSCSIATTVHFNKDFSGEYAIVMDLSEFMGMAAMFDSTGTMDQNSMTAQMRHKLDSLDLAGTYNGMSGIRNAKTEVSDEGVMTISFNFDNVESLNASFLRMKEKAEQDAAAGVEMDEMMPTDLLGGGNQSYVRQGKKITHVFSSEDDTSGLFSGDDADQLEMFSSMIDYTYTMTFDRKVKSADVKGLNIIEKDAHAIKMRVDFGDLMKEGKYSVSVSTK